MMKTICNMCDKEFAMGDDFSINHQFGYGSVHDGDDISVDLCNPCLDKLATFLIENCVHNPIEESDTYMGGE